MCCGEAQIQEVEEDAPIKFSPIETGEVELRITDYVGDGWYITDKMREDGAQIPQLQAARANEARRGIQERFETQALATLAAGHTEADANAVNGFAHRIVPTSTNNTLELGDLIKMRLAFNKAEIPAKGRIGIVDPVVEATLNTTFQIVSGTGDLAANSTWQMITESGMSQDHSFVISLYGWDIITSNRLPTSAAGVASDGTTTVTDAAVINLFMSVADDNTKPLMAAWRRVPSAEGERNVKLRRDEFSITARWGMGVQRVDTLGTIPASAINLA